MSDGTLFLLILAFVVGLGVFLFTSTGLSLLARLLAPTSLKPSA